jgi:hypothetical protein
VEKASRDLFASPGASNIKRYWTREGLMSDSVKERIAECYRRAEEYKKLYHRASNFDEREIYLSIVRQFLRVAEGLDPRREILTCDNLEQGF